MAAFVWEEPMPWMMGRNVNGYKVENMKQIYRMASKGREYEYWYDSSVGKWYAAQVDQYGSLGRTIHTDLKEEIEHIIRSGNMPIT